MAEEAGLRLRSATGRWTLVATVMASGMAFIDGTVVNVALPRIGHDFQVGLADLQWTVTGYALTLSAFLLLGGTLGDRYGRRRLFLVGIAWFALASLLCAVAPNAPILIGARTLQGMGSALLTPGSLSIIEASFRREDRGPAIGAWSGFSALFGALGPILGGVVVQFATWRLAFFINLPIAAVAILISLRHVPESRSPGERGPLDVPGPVLAALSLGGITYGLIEGPASGWPAADVAALTAGLLLFAVFILAEFRVRNPLMPPSIFRSRQFSGANTATFAIYGALGAVLFLLVIQLQDGLGYSPLLAGVALLPSILLLLLFASASGRLAARIGPRLPMTAGPLLAGAGMALLMRVTPGAGYVTTVLPGVLVFGSGLVLTVPALTTTALGALPADQAGLASAVNNDVARAAGLIAVAVIPALAGIPTGGSAVQASVLAVRFPAGMLICAVLCAAGGVVSFLTIPGRTARQLSPVPDPGR
jgi:EmrB/QacA subfamily drug resistance transporter